MFNHKYNVPRATCDLIIYEKKYIDGVLLYLR